MSSNKPYDLKIDLEAREERDWLCQTYGSAFCEAFELWCRKIAAEAPFDPGNFVSVSLGDILDREHSKWKYVWEKVRDQTSIDRLISLYNLIKTRKPPYELLAFHSRLHAQSSFWVNIIATVEIDRTKKQVVVYQLNWFGD